MADSKSKKKIEKKLRGSIFSFAKVPSGIVLTADETKEVVQLWQDDLETIQKNALKLKEAEHSIDTNLRNLPQQIQTVDQSRAEAARYFKISKNPVKRREWARRLIVADNAHKSIQASKTRMEVTKQRIESVVKDAAIEKIALDVRIAEAQAYIKMGEGLRLVGETLASARNRAKRADLEYTTLEFNTEQFETHITELKDTKLIEQANEILK